jgi:hypothetical protein
LLTDIALSAVISLTYIQTLVIAFDEPGQNIPVGFAGRIVHAGAFGGMIAFAGTCVTPIWTAMYVIAAVVLRLWRRIAAASTFLVWLFDVDNKPCTSVALILCILASLVAFPVAVLKWVGGP